MLNDLLNYENLKIYQRKDMFNFSIDTVLLARFATINNKVKNILDIGTNNAAIPLILSTQTLAHITGVEIQKDAIMLAQENVILNNRAEQIAIVHADIKEYIKAGTDNKFDLIICNPPFFKVGDYKLNEKSTLLIPARHETHLTLSDLIASLPKIIKNKGYFAMVHRVNRLAEIFTLLTKHSFAVKRLQFIYPFHNSEAANVLIEATFQGAPGLKVEEPIIVHDQNGEYSLQVQKWFSK
ncbi:tRNA1(Val) (adenine(37)-N6)-methyltransferase [Spiroplasma chrysopicola]|uniref:Methyltransferase n=1 Tax=Spiroplasma chrysopicola DF-1 TaxID=1276227 RepID=R4U2C4_9MOLU|nr:methyltransferase [Spiroplasma chrysopicola DF-1]